MTKSVTVTGWLGTQARREALAALGAVRRSPAGRVGPARLALDAAAGVVVATGLGVLAPARPDRLVRAGLALRRWGVGPAAAVGAAAARFPDAVAVVADDATVSYGQLDRRSDAVARALAARGVAPGAVVGLLGRNSAALVTALVGAAKAGADLVLLNTGFAAGQVAAVCRAEGVDLLVADDEFADQAPEGLALVRTGAGPAGIEALAALAPAGPPPPPGRVGRVVILTSGTTGTPKGAPRSGGAGLDAGVALLSRIPFRQGGTTVLAPPLFHAWGFGNLMTALALSATVVVHRRFDPAVTLDDLARHRARVLVAVPVMLERLLEQAGDRPPAGRLEVVAVSGSALPGSLAVRFMDTFGDVLYNLYGSTEVAWATIAGPAELRRHPDTAGSAPWGTVVEVVDDEGRPVPVGQRGRIVVGNGLGVAAYSDGAAKAVVRGLIDTGDVGRLDGDGLLYVEGRADDMIVSGGENVFPGEVEELLAAHPQVREVAVVGVDDERFGQRLAAYVVRRDDRLDEAAVRAHVRDHLARYKVPRDVVFVDRLPRNPAGKVVRRRLPAAGGGRARRKR